MKYIVSPAVTERYKKEPDFQFCAVLFRNVVYVATPRHADAINMAFEKFTHHQKHRIAWRIGH